MAACLALAAIATPVDAQRNRNTQVAALVYSSQATLNAYKKQTDAKLVAQRRDIERMRGQIASLKRDIRAGSGNRRALESQIATLEQQAAEQKDAFTTRLAELEADYAREREALLNTGQRLLETEAGREALALFNDGSPEAWDKAKAILEGGSNVALERAAIDLRATARLYYEKRDTGQETTQSVLAVYRKLTVLDQGEFADWLTLAELHTELLQLDEARRAAARALDLADEPFATWSANMLAGNIASLANDRAQADASFAAAVDAAQAYLDAGGKPVTVLQDALNAQATTLLYAGQMDEGIALLHRAHATLQEALAAEPDNGPLLLAQAESYGLIGYALTLDGRAQEGLVYLQNALAIVRRISTASPDSIAARENLLVALTALGDSHVELGQHAEAAPLFAEALDLSRGVLAADPQSSTAQGNLAEVLLRNGQVALATDNGGDAGEFLRESLGLWAGLIEREMAVEDYWIGAYNALLGLGDAAIAESDSAEAAAAYRRALGIADSHIGDAGAGDDRVDLALWQELRAIAQARLANSAAPPAPLPEPETAP